MTTTKETTMNQSKVVNALNAALMRNTEAKISASSLAESIAGEFPDVPVPVLRLLAARVLEAHFEPITLDEVKRLPEADDQEVACSFLGEAAQAEADTQQVVKVIRALQQAQSSGKASADRP